MPRKTRTKYRGTGGNSKRGRHKRSVSSETKKWNLMFKRGELA